MIQRGARLADPDQYEKLLADLPSLYGNSIDPVTGEEGQINGAEFWRSGSIASQYTGRYGTDRLVGMIRGLIAKTQSDVEVFKKMSWGRPSTRAVPTRVSWPGM